MNTTTTKSAFNWPVKLNNREERERAAAGIYAKAGANAGWYKTVNGKTRYICRPCPLAEALAILPAKLSAITGEGIAVAQVPTGSMSIDALGDTFLAEMDKRVKRQAAKTMERSTYLDYVDTLSRFSAIVGPTCISAALQPADFTRAANAMWANRSVTTKRREMAYIDRLFNWSEQMGLLASVPRKGPDWIKPGLGEIAQRAKEADKAYTVEEVRAAFKRVAGNPLLNVSAHLGFFCAYGPEDIATIPVEAVESGLAGGVLRFPRFKTLKHCIDRVNPLLPCVVNAIEQYRVARDKRRVVVKESAKPFFFRTIHGAPLVHEYSDSEENAVTKEWSKRKIGPFSGLRSGFANIADSWPDSRAVDAVMGQRSGSVRHVHYATRFDDSRVRALVEHVAKLVWPDGLPVGPSIAATFPIDAGLASA